MQVAYSVFDEATLTKAQKAELKSFGVWLALRSLIPEYSL